MFWYQGFLAHFVRRRKKKPCKGLGGGGERRTHSKPTASPHKQRALAERPTATKREHKRSTRGEGARRTERAKRARNVFHGKPTASPHKPKGAHRAER